jgi:hypothetical protein
VPISFFQKITNIGCKFIKAVKNAFHEKAACKMLERLTPVVNFINILQAAFAQILFIPKVRKPNCN